MGVARFDGDLPRDSSIMEFERFKNDPNCRILLMTVQSGGVGLNIVEANHIAFLDRWYNPFVHAQAEDRCHRIGQKKDVNIVYFDCAATIDEAMYQINKVKTENSAILLADGFEIGSEQQSLGYKELSGLLGKLMKTVRTHRKAFLSAVGDDNAGVPIPPCNPQNIASVVESATGLATSRKAYCDYDSASRTTSTKSTSRESGDTKPGGGKRVDPKRHSVKALEDVADDLVDTDDEENTTAAASGQTAHSGSTKQFSRISRHHVAHRHKMDPDHLMDDFNM